MYLSYSNSSIYYEVNGEGPALVLLHGFMEDLSMWNPFVTDLSSKCKVIRIDLLGHGKSDCIAKIHSMALMAEVVYEVIKTVGVNHIKIVGHSMGGYVALALAEKYPELISDLVLLNSTYEADTKERKELRDRAIEQSEASKEAYEKLIRLSFSNLFAQESLKSHATEYHSALGKALKTPLCGYVAALNGMRSRPNRFNILANIRGTKSIVVGLKDSLIDLKTLHKKIQNSSIELVEFSEGHMSHIENKSELSYFLKRLIEK